MIAPLFAAALALTSVQTTDDGAPPASADAVDPARAALDAATATIQRGGLDAAGLAAAWADKARAYAALGDADKATRAFAVALRADPSLRPRDDDEAARAAFAAALAALPARPLVATASRTAVDDAIRVQVRVDVDDLGLAKRARALSADDGAQEEAAFVEGVASFGADAPRIALLDKHGNVLRVLDVVDEVPVTEPVAVDDAAPRPTTWLSLAGAATIGVGGAGVIAAGLGYATLGGPGSDEATRGWLLAGTAASTGVILVGGALVVADLLLSGG